MAITFQKRQKEMKRLEKRREKEERRAQKKLEKRAKDQAIADGTAIETPDTELEQPADRDF
ncbi:MAG: hypothetical protein WBL50_11525 [Candidatus Acidiferrum sp.]|jgi:hypothetical protein